MLMNLEGFWIPICYFYFYWRKIPPKSNIFTWQANLSYIFVLHSWSWPAWGSAELGQGYNCPLRNGALSAALGGEGLGHACLSDIGEAPFSCPNEEKGYCFIGEGIVVRGANESFFFTTSCHYSFYYFHDEEVCQITSKFLYKHLCFDKHYFKQTNPLA